MLREAYTNIMAAKLRSFLAVLGVLVGTAAVVALMGCGQLATAKALAQFKALGTDLLAISVYPKSSDSHQTEIPLNTWREFPEKIPAISQIAPYAMAYQTISFQGTLLTGAIIGADESLASLLNIKLKAGHFVSFVESFEHFCVIGHGLAQQIHAVNFESPIGKPLQVGQTLYTIIGIAKPWKENAFFNEDINRAVIVPIAGIVMVNKDAKVNNAVLRLHQNTNIEVVIAQIKATIEASNATLNIFIRSAKQIIASMESQGRIFTLLLAIIGGISLLVGGIGVMNVMLVSVGERKREIGIRKAVGARKKDIQLLFLFESMLLSLFGGVMGIGLGILFTAAVAFFSHWEFTIHLLPTLSGFTVSVLTGIFFGFYPAKRAANLEPVDCLRQS